MKIHSVLGVSDQFFQQKWPFYNVQLWFHRVTTLLLVVEVLLLHCIKLPEKLSLTLECKTNTFSIPIHKWVHFHFSKHYFMAIRKHKYQTDEHTKCVTTVAIYELDVFHDLLWNFCHSARKVSQIEYIHYLNFSWF